MPRLKPRSGRPMIQRSSFAAAIAMTGTTPVAILGFTPFERSTFEAFLQLASRRTPAYQLAGDPFSADFIIVDADDPVLVMRVQAAGFLPRSVMLGANALPGAALHLYRPFNLMQMVRSLDALPRPLRAESAAEAPRAPQPGPFEARPSIRIPVPAGSVSLLPPSATLSRDLQAGADGS
jgi:two-component system, cell cycle response regulator